MANFDDLISSTRNLTLDNPFEDPFADVGRPRSPDPWSTASYWQQQPPTPPPQDVRPESPQSDVFIYPTSKEDEMPEATSASHVPPDPLADILKATQEEAPTKHSPLGPLPIIPKEPEPISIVDKAERLASPTIESPPAAPLPQSNDGPVQESRPSPSTEDAPSLPLVKSPLLDDPTGQRVSDSSVSTNPASTTPSAGSLGPGPTLSVSAASHKVISPPLPPSPHTPVARTIPVTSRTETSPSVSSSTYRHIVSPLDTPVYTAPPDRSYSGLSLGGEVPGWGGAGSAAPSAAATPSRPSTQGFMQVKASPEPEPQEVEAKPEETPEPRVPEPVELQKIEKPEPLFVITVGDPQKVGDPISAHIVYTVHTKTSSPLYSKPEFSVLRRYSDFLWLVSALSANNPGVIIPPVPEKSALNRFQDSFVESRMLGLNRCIQKIANHAMLSTDPDLKFFLESDSFQMDIRHRRPDIGPERGGGLIATIGNSLAGSKFFEIDEWFDQKKSYLDGLESQLRALVKSIEMVSKQRGEMAQATAEFAESVASLAAAGLSNQLSQSLNMLAEVEKQSKDVQTAQATDDVVTILATAEEYTRLIQSVRLSFASRIRAHATWQQVDTEARRTKQSQEKFRRQGRIPSERLAASLADVADAERKATESRQDFENISKLIKAEMVRFERERVEDFKKALEEFLDGMINKQKQLIKAWEDYQSFLLKGLEKNPTPTSQPVQPAPAPAPVAAVPEGDEESGEWQG
ncbi:hypothetical protein BOTBODRAFT_51951 [Botryobasidium botryosum FD-172 SS1]|uniref:PX domain-containing protein n=1 Tax=Botryobasidium botryosum (strain FD-172 SS1) TaxID=930990 RepID=A0A067MVF9_BOTB1|nr:hypothetical protein BOTBODRAFT_51951 [Botryobasidium botryosum FD-172 SS1]